MSGRLPPGYIELTSSINRSGSTRNESIVTAWETDIDPNAAEAAVIADTFMDNMDDNMGSTFVRAGSVVRVGDPSGIPVVYVIPDSTVGPDTYATIAPPQVAVLVQKVSSLGGRANRGRMYIPWLDESKVNGAGLLDGSEQTQYQTIVDSMRTAMLALARITNMVILHSDHLLPTAEATSGSATVGAERELFRTSDVGRELASGPFTAGTTVLSVALDGKSAVMSTNALSTALGVSIKNEDTPTTVTGLVVQSYVATQRRRLRR